jgi:hypothetical protein
LGDVAGVPVAEDKIRGIDDRDPSASLKMTEEKEHDL